MDPSNATSWLRRVEDRWCGVGCSDELDSRGAGAEAAAGAMAGDSARLVMVLTSDAYEPESLLAGIRSVTGDVPLIGCSTAGEITPAGPADATVAVLVLGGPGFTVATAESSVLRGCREAGEEVAGSLGQLDAPHKVLMLLPDGAAINHQDIVRGAHSQAGPAIPVVGGFSAEGALRLRRPFQLKDGGVRQHTVVAAAIGSTGPFGIGVRHGWRPVGEPMTVSWDATGRISRLDDEPALDAYLNRLMAPEDAYWDPYSFDLLKQTQMLGLIRSEGEEGIRGVGEANFEDRTIGVQAIDHAEGGLVRVMQADPASLLDAAGVACSDALEAIGRPALGLVAFDCSSRKYVLGQYRGAEVDRIVAHAAGAPVAGFYSYGEIATMHGPSGYHHGTLIVLALG
ncbi:MAG: FIST N-terminal domain-containing protein [Candidatus Limnocylindrales bacterium]